MSTGSVDAIERSVHKTNEWLADLASELGVDREEAWRILRAFLQLLRDRITVDEAAHLAAQLPHLLRGVFYEGFDPGHSPEKIRDAGTFLAQLADRAELAGSTDASLTAEAAMRTLRRHVTDGEVDEVLAQLPQPIRSLLEPS
jgi:uncharacterized protein (DUF2267 family)